MVTERYILEIQKVIDFIESNIHTPITVESLCELSSFSQWEFQRIFRAIVSDSIGNYLKGRRLSLAAEDLKKGHLKIIDIAINYQFSSQESFSRAFKDYFSYTPGFVKREKISLISKMKPYLDKSRLDYISLNISHIPKIEEIDSKQIVGLNTKFESTLASEKKSYNKISNHWTKFNCERKKIKNKVKNFSYGVIITPHGDMNCNELNYLAGAEVSSFSDFPHTMKIFEIKSQKYAIFEIRGNTHSCHIAADFIYGIWLPQSKHKRINSFDLEIYDHKLYKKNQSDSISYYCLPIE